MPDLDTLERGWDQAARSAPLANIMTIPGLTEAEFWQMGVREIDDLIAQLDLAGHKRALDFGCGVGRLTQPLAEHFDRVDGVDISGEMIRLANEHNTLDRVRFHHNQTADLALFDDDTFDLVYTTIVLQHMLPELAAEYVREFLRVTRPSGLVVFQIPDGTSSGGTHWLSMHGTSRDTVESWLDGAELVNVETNDAAGAGYTSYRYTVRV